MYNVLVLASTCTCTCTAVHTTYLLLVPIGWLLLLSSEFLYVHSLFYSLHIFWYRYS